MKARSTAASTVGKSTCARTCASLMKAISPDSKTLVGNISIARGQAVHRIAVSLVLFDEDVLDAALARSSQDFGNIEHTAADLREDVLPRPHVGGSSRCPGDAIFQVQQRHTPG